MPDREKVIRGLECCTFILGKRKCNECPYQKGLPDNGCYQLQDDFHDLLKEQEAKERKWLQAIADNQIANAPKDSPMSLDEQLESEYKSGIYDGLQMAYEILMEGR